LPSSLSLLEGTESSAVDRAVVHEHIRSSAVHGDEAVALLSVEPLDGSLRHSYSYESPDDRTSRPPLLLHTGPSERPVICMCLASGTSSITHTAWLACHSSGFLPTLSAWRDARRWHPLQRRSAPPRATRPGGPTTDLARNGEMGPMSLQVVPSAGGGPPRPRLVRPPVDRVPVPDLTTDQQRVVEHRGGPLLVVGGPGTGKTTVLAEAAVRRPRS